MKCEEQCECTTLDYQTEKFNTFRNEWWSILLGFPGGSVVKNFLVHVGDARDTSLIPGLCGSDGKVSVYNVRDLGSIPGNLNPPPGKVAWRRKWQSTPVLLPWKSHGRRSLVQATIHGVAKSPAWLSNFTFTFWNRKWQLTCLGNPMDRGTWWATFFGVAKESDRT